MSIFQLTSSLQQDLLHTLDLNRSRIVLEGNFSPQPASYQTVQLSKDLGQSTILKICAEAEGIFALNVQADEKVSTLLLDREARIIKTFTWTSYNNKASLIALGNDKFAVLSYGALFLCDSQDTKATKWQPDFLKQTAFSCQTLTPIPGGRIALAGNLEDAGPMQQYWVAIVSHQGKTLSYWISEAPSKASMHQGSWGYHAKSSETINIEQIVCYSSCFALHFYRTSRPPSSRIESFDFNCRPLSVWTPPATECDETSIQQLLALPDGSLTVTGYNISDKGRDGLTCSYWLTSFNSDGKLLKQQQLPWSCKITRTSSVSLRMLIDQKKLYLCNKISDREFGQETQTTTDTFRFLSYNAEHTTELFKVVMSHSSLSQPHQSFQVTLNSDKIIALPDNSWLVSMGDKIKKYDEKSKTCTAVFAGHTKPVTDIILLSDRRFASTSTEQMCTKVWDLTTGECLHTFAGLTGTLLLGDKGKLLVASKAEGLIYRCTLPLHPIRLAELDPIWNALKTNQSVTRCNFEEVGLGNAGVRLLAEVLLQNRTIISINLKNNAIGDEGGRTLLAALRINKTVKTLALEGNPIHLEILQKISYRLTKGRFREVMEEPAIDMASLKISPTLFCPHTKLLMFDSVITPEGDTFEFEAVLGKMKGVEKFPPNKSVQSQIAALVQQYPALAKNALYFPLELQRESLKAALNNQEDKLTELALIDSRVLTHPLRMDEQQPPLTLLGFAISRGPLNLLKRVVLLLGEQRFLKQADNWPGGAPGLFTESATKLGGEAGKVIGDALDWTLLDYEDRLIEAVLAENKTLAEILLLGGVSCDLINERGNSLLHLAVEARSPALIELLLTFGASSKITNPAGQTAKDLAMALGQLDLVRLIEAKKQALKMATHLKPLVATIEELKMENEKLKEELASIRKHSEKAVAAPKDQS